MTNNSIKKIKHGGLYEMMNLALKQAYNTNFKYIFFIQDDLQFLQYINLSEWCDKTFKKWNNTFMISPLFFQKIYSPHINEYIEKKKGDFLFKNYGVADIGIIYLERAKKIGLKFDNKGEKHNGNNYYKKNHQLIFSSNPCLSWVPWVYSYKNKNKKGLSFHNNVSAYIKYINENNKLKLYQNKKIPFMEDYTSLDNSWIPKPYIFLNLSFKNTIIAYLKYWKYVILNPLANDQK